MSKIINVNKALACEDATISIGLAELPTPRKAQKIFEAQGKEIAQILWDHLPAASVVALMAELDRLESINES